MRIYLTYAKGYASGIPLHAVRARMVAQGSGSGAKSLSKVQVPILGLRAWVDVPRTSKIVLIDLFGL